MNNLKPFGTGGNAQEEVGYLTKLLMPDIANRMSMLASVVEIFAGWETCSPEVFLRRGFGIRYFNPLRALLGFVMLNVVLLILGYHSTPYYLYYASLTDWVVAILRNNPVALGYVLLSATHLAIGWWKTRHGVVWHTRFFGESNLIWLIRRLPIKIAWLNNEWLVYRLLEPGFVLLIGLLLRNSNPVFANWLLISAGLMWLRAQIVFTFMLNSLYDRHDALIEATYWNDAMNGAPSSRTAGFVTVTGIPGLSDKPRNTPAEIKTTVAEAMKRPTGQRNTPPSD